MKFQKKMIILTTAAVATFGLIACGAAVADAKKDDNAAVKPMAMKSAVKGGKMGGCEHGGKGGMKGGCEHGGKGGMMNGRMGMKPMARPIKIQVDDVTIIILVNKDGSAKVAKMGGCEHGGKGGAMKGGCEHGGKGGAMKGGCDHGKKAAPAAVPNAEPAKK